MRQAQLQHHRYHTTLITTAILAILAALLISGLYGCGTAPQQQAPQAESLPVVQLTPLPATTWQEYMASVEGRVNVEIRPQVDGYLEHIYIEEGDYVRAGQPLFRIDDGNYREQANNAQANLQAARANLEKAGLEVERLEPLVRNNIVSEMQLKTALSVQAAAKASVAQAQAMSRNAGINAGYTLIKAPANGYISRIPYKKGSLVGRGEPQPLAVLSDVSEVYAYFSMSETEYLQFEKQVEGSSLQEKINQLPAVSLVLADNSIYAEKGRIELAEGQFDRTMGAISFRAVFPNRSGMLRSGNTGKVRIPQLHESVLPVPQEATYEIQDKVFVFTVEQGNKVSSRPIAIAGRNGHYYFVSDGLKAGDRIVYSGLGRLKDGASIVPQPLSMDSLIQINPL